MADLYGEKEDGRGKHMHIPVTDFRKQKYIEWLTTPPKDRDPKTKTDLAEMLGVTRMTLHNWQEDKEFVEAWEKRYLKTIGDPGRKQTIMDTLYRTATDGDDPKHVQAAKQYFEIEGSLQPQKMKVEISGTAKDLSDEDLDKLLAEVAASEKKNRAS
jgi:hypothetical protein